MQYDFNGVNINLKDKYCRLWDYNVVPAKPQANLYIRVTNTCNANCKFCIYHGDYKTIDIDKFEKALKELRDRDIINKIQITGGEPSIATELHQLICIVREYFSDNFIGINSNGTDLARLKSVNSMVDNFAISRHHYKDDINRKIFNTNQVPDSEQLKDFIQTVGKDKIHFSCTLMKDYIGNIEEIKKYLDYVSSIGCEDVGFVSLMDTNEYALEQRVTFYESGIEECKDFLKYKQYVKHGDCCRCANYLYFSTVTGKMIDIYGRFATDKDEATGMLSFDKDTLREGFNGKVIPIN